MAGGKLSPRQKMINLMYLVFIAMLAMQIDREVLRSFERTAISLELSNNLMQKNNNDFYDLIAKRASNDPDYIPVKKFTDEVRKKADDLFQHVQKIKEDLESQTGWAPPKEGEETKYSSLNNTDVIQKLMFQTNGPTKAASELKSKIEEFKAFLLKNLDPKSSTDKIIIDQVNTFFDTRDKGEKTWLQVLFYEQPMIAAKTNLTKIQSDVRTVEGNIIRSKLTSKMMEDIEIKQFVGIVSAPRYVAINEDVTAFASLGAFDNTISGTANINGRSIPIQDGKATFNLDTSSPGQKTISGSLTFKDSKGQMQTIPIEPTTYEVVKQVTNNQMDAIISADKMNVVYRGLENPISATVIGGDQSSVNLSASSGLLSRSGAGWIFKPTTGKTVDFTVSGKSKQGSFSKVVKFRIKDVPPPQGQIRGQNVITLPASSIPNQQVTAAIPDFDFPVSFTVTSCYVKIPGRAGMPVSGNRLSSVEGAVKQLKPGDVVYVYNIEATATGLGGQAIKNISPVVINVQ